MKEVFFHIVPPCDFYPPPPPHGNEWLSYVSPPRHPICFYCLSPCVYFCLQLYCNYVYLSVHSFIHLFIQQISALTEILVTCWWISHSLWPQRTGRLVRETKQFHVLEDKNLNSRDFPGDSGWESRQASTASVAGSIPGRGTRILHDTQWGKKQTKKNQYCYNKCRGNSEKIGQHGQGNQRRSRTTWFLDSWSKTLSFYEKYPLV